MFAYYLLFETEEQFLRFSKLPVDPELLVRLNIDIVEEYLCGFSSKFPKQFIHKMNTDFKVAEYRHAVFQDLYNNSNWKFADELCNQISFLYSQSNRIDSMVNSIQKKIASVYVATQYFALIERICAFVSSFQSVGLQRVFDIFQSYLLNQETTVVKAAIFKTETLLNLYLRTSLKIDRVKKRITIFESECETSTDLQTLNQLCQRLTGISVLEPFSIVDASSPTKLEKFTIEYILEKHEDLEGAIEETPHVEFLWEQLKLFQTQISFYISFIKLTEQLKEKNLPFCYPIFDYAYHFYANNIYDLSLSIRNMQDVSFVQTSNDIDLKSNSFGYILTGANQGGKTTFLRATGIAVYLAMCGCPVPAKRIILRPYHVIVALFGGEEDFQNEASRFEIEVKKYCLYRDTIGEATFVLLNEFFVGTNRSEAVNILSQCIIELTSKKATYGCVTHFQEIHEILGDSMNSHIQYLRAELPNDVDGVKRYIIVKEIPNGRAYSEQIVRKTGMTYDMLLQQFKERGICGV